MNRINLNPFRLFQSSSPSPDNKNPSNSAEKTSNAASSNFKLLTKGAAKMVFVNKNAIPASSEQTKAYYTPKTGFKESILGSKERELKKEHAIMETIKERVQGKEKGSTENLAVESTVVENIGLKGSFILEVDLAVGDYESAMSKGIPSNDAKEGEKAKRLPLTSKERVQLGKQFAKAISQLHEAKFSYGDIKPENCLIYRDKEGIKLKLSDFGKAKDISEKSHYSYEGNLRFAPPEGIQSELGDIYGAALVLIRNFEEKYLEENGDPLPNMPIKDLNIENEEKDGVADSKYRGIERFLIENKTFLATNSGFSLKSIQRRLKLKNQDYFVRLDQQKVMTHYIRRLESKIAQDTELSADPKEREKLAAGLADLLIKMTDVYPSKRGTMKGVVDTLDRLFPNE